MKITPVKLDPYHVYRECHTGVTEYSFCRGNTKIGGFTDPVMPVKTVYIQTDIMELLCDVDIDMTVFPGAQRELFYADRETRTELHARIVYEESGHHRITRCGLSYDVYYQEGKYYIYEEGTPLAMISVASILDTTPMAPNAPRMTMRTKKAIAPDLAVLLLSFPMLQISYY